MPNLRTTSSSQPDTDLEFKGRKRLTQAQRDDMALNLMNGIQAALGDREPYNDNLDLYIRAYEQFTEERDWPYENAANIVTPLITTQVDSLVSYICGQVLLPRLFMVTGVTSEAAGYAHQVERYYNSEVKRQRGSKTWFEELYKWEHLATRDGISYMECLWKYRKTTMKMRQWETKMEAGDDGTPSPVLDDKGVPVQEPKDIDVDDIYNDVEWRNIPSRNFFTIPAAALSVDEALACVVDEFLTEDFLNEQVRDGIMWKDEVDRALNFVPTGSTELNQSQLSALPYTAGGQLGIGGAQGTQIGEFWKNRGPIEVFRVHSRQYDLDGDGECEENIFWVHAASWRLLGWTRYEYFTSKGTAVVQRPFFPFVPLPRSDTLIGFSLVERLLGLQNEKDALRRQRLDEGALRMSPPWVVKKGSYEEDTEFSFGLNQMMELEDPEHDIQRLPMGELPQFSYMEEQMIERDAQGFTGLTAPMMGQNQSGRHSATEARQAQAAAQTRTGIIAMRFRMAINSLINFTHQLKKQYLDTDQQFAINGQQYKLPLPVMQMDYLIETTGSSDPVDATSRRNELIGAIPLFMQFPLIQGNMMHQYYLLRKMCDAFDWADAEKIIGTEQEVQQMMAAQQQQAQMQQMLGGLGGAPGGPPGGPQGGPPGGGGGGGGFKPPPANPPGV